MGFFRERPLIFSLVSGLPQEGGDQDIRALQGVLDKKQKTTTLWGNSSFDFSSEAQLILTCHP